MDNHFVYHFGHHIGHHIGHHFGLSIETLLLRRERDYTHPTRRGIQLPTLAVSRVSRPHRDIVGTLKMILPMDIVDQILSYGDPEITNRFRCVHYQIKYHKREFDVLRHTPYNTYYRWQSHQFRYFILSRANDKNQLNGDPAPTMPTTCALYYPRRWINTYISPPYDSDDSDGELPELIDHDDSDDELPELML